MSAIAHRHARALVVGIAAALPAAAAMASAASAARHTYSVDVVKKLGPHVTAAHSGGVAVLLPARYISDLPASKLYAAGGRTPKGYKLSLAAAPGCNDSTACFVADFTATKGGTPFGSQPVTLAKGITGRVQPLSCGASCSPPSVEWVSDGVLYDIQANIVTPGGSANSALVALANSAISHGSR